MLNQVGEQNQVTFDQPNWQLRTYYKTIIICLVYYISIRMIFCSDFMNPLQDDDKSNELSLVSYAYDI